ncbi:hypothetical protein BROUX41_001925 [Berkeleyomyces rouxiae]
MPAVGDQHQAGIVNPFEEPQTRVSAYTADEIATLQYRLDKQLGPEYISNRQGPGGGRVHYLAADKVINLANEVLGFNGWSSSIQNIQVDFVDENPQTARVSLGLSVIMRVTLRDGTFHEDVGYGHIENAKGKAAAFEKAKKEGTTDALKRTLRNFGNVLGNCIYDKDYLSKVTRVKPMPVKFDEQNLYRHGDKNRLNRIEAAPTISPVQTMAQITAPPRPASVPPGGIKSAPSAAVQQIAAAASGNNSRAASPAPVIDSMDDLDNLMDDIDDADLCMAEEGHPDEIVLPGTTEAPNGGNPHSSGNSNQGPQMYNKSVYQPAAPQTPVHNSRSMPVKTNGNGPAAANRGMPPTRAPQFNQNTNPTGPNGQMHTNGEPGPGPGPPRLPNGNEPVGFFSARAVSQLPETAINNPSAVPAAQYVFNPKAESPSIRKTPGVDHNSSKPVARNLQHVPPASSQQQQQQQQPSGPAAPHQHMHQQHQGAQQSPSLQRATGPATRSVSGAGAGANLLNPHLDHTRRIGAPPAAAGSPLGNRGQYRPPKMMKRPPQGAPQYPQLQHQQQYNQPQHQQNGPAAAQVGRQALSEVTNNNPMVAGGQVGPDNKRPRLT